MRDGGRVGVGKERERESPEGERKVGSRVKARKGQRERDVKIKRN